MLDVLSSFLKEAFFNPVRPRCCVCDACNSLHGKIAGGKDTLGGFLVFYPNGWGQWSGGTASTFGLIQVLI